jgi:hypothetical protein
MRSLTHTALTATLLSALFAAPALAQETKPEGDSWLDEKSDPLSPEKTPASEKAELTPAEKKKRDRQINKNYSDAQKTYQQILTSDPSAPLARRIANNERIVKEFGGRIQRSAKERRQAQVDLYNRTFYIKGQRDKKQITPEVYENLIAQEEEKFNRIDASFKRNVAAWQKEVDDAQKRLSSLRAQKRLLDAKKPRARKVRRRGKGQAAGKAAPTGSRLVGTLRQRLDRLAASANYFRTRIPLRDVHPRTLGSPITRRGAPKVEEDNDDE